MKNFLTLLFCFCLYGYDATAQNSFPICSGGRTAGIVYDPAAPPLDSVAAYLLAADIEKATGKHPAIYTSLQQAKGAVIVLGAAGSSLVAPLLKGKPQLAQQLKGKWESYVLTVLASTGREPMLVVAGSDSRGTAYGALSLSEKIGVSPWYWWADVPVRQQKDLLLHQPDFVSNEPTVKYRGIFINDEDWGLLPWASGTFEPEVKNIGPRTYAKIFELLLRLRANLVWPAMHPGTAPFFTVPGNAAMAQRFGILVGSSHAEPMLRNNVGEWNEKTMGHFNYLTNREKVFGYWEERVRQSKGIPAIYSMGMRGVHDSGMEGVKDPKDAAPLLEKIISEQRQLLSRELGDSVPQVFTAYKEVLDIYDQGLRLPDDITLVWPDDNYGYIQRLNSAKEQHRTGGSGVYYHASYWGRPHDYLWLPGTHPALMRSEMMKAYQTGARQLWVLNVGDIKPLEYAIQLFMDMAYDATAFTNSTSTRKHMQGWYAGLFGAQHAPALTQMMWQYYQLAFERRPEFMGWSQTEPTTATRPTGYNHFAFGDEAMRRLQQYESLHGQSNQIKRRIPAARQDAFYQLIHYPVAGAHWINKKFLFRDKANLYAQQGRLSAKQYVLGAHAAQDSILQATHYFNDTLAGGKWKGIMSAAPRSLPVFEPVRIQLPESSPEQPWNALPEQYDTLAQQQNASRSLPLFTEGLQQAYFIDVFLCRQQNLSWQITAAPWISVSQPVGTLGKDKTEHRIQVSIDWQKAPAAMRSSSNISVVGGGQEITIAVPLFRPNDTMYRSYKGAVENDGVVSLFAAHALHNKAVKASHWQLEKDLGHTGSVFTAAKDTIGNISRNDAAELSFPFWSFSASAPTVQLFTLPTHPLNKTHSMQMGISIDDCDMQVVDFKTVGRSETWKQNVLRNSAIVSATFPTLKPGKHILKVYALDPGVQLDRILIAFKPMHSYSVVPATIKVDAVK